MWSRHVPTSRARERGRSTQRANGARAAVPVTTGGRSFSRRRASGAAIPATRAAPAATRMAVDRRTARASVSAASDVLVRGHVDEREIDHRDLRLGVEAQPARREAGPDAVQIGARDDGAAVAGGPREPLARVL